MQPPTPSQTFVPPHGLPTVQSLSVALAAIGAQVPRLPAMLHALQASQLFVLQQKLSTQLPELHVLAVAAVQAEPFGLRPQLLGVVPWQVWGARQSASVTHVTLQALAPQMYGVQDDPVAVAQLPLPLQFDEGVYVDPVQLDAPQGMPVSACWHVPLPVQFPVLPQGMLFETGHFPCNSGCPDGMLAQDPALPGTLHAWHIGHDAAEQQTPSTQLRPLKQSLVTVQLSPGPAKFPHLFVFGSQLCPGWHCASTVQVVLHPVVPLHENGAHEPVVATLQVPEPSHVRALVSVIDPVGQLEPTQTVPAAYFAQAPAPLQTPVVPHDAAPWSLQVEVGSGWPLGTLLHVPASAADTLHDLHVPLQFVEQQTPWLQKPDLHSVPAEHVRPGSFNPHELFPQVFGDEQSLLLAHAALHAPVPQRNGAQELEAGFTHLPAPSQLDLAVNVVDPLGQLGSAQVVPLPYF